MSTLFEAFERKYADMEFPNGTMIEPSTPSDVAGRYFCRERHKLFAGVAGKVVNRDGSTRWAVPNRALLSPRRIYREHARRFYGEHIDANPAMGRVDAEISDAFYVLLRELAKTGRIPARAVKVRGWRVRLVPSEVADA